MKTAMATLVCVLVGTWAFGAETALQFDGNDVGVVPNSSSLNPANITIECQVNFGRLAGGDPHTHVQMLVCKGWDYGSGSYRLMEGDGGLAFGCGNYGATTYQVSIQTNHWYHMAGTYDGQDMRLYLDGNQITATHVVGLTVGNSYPLYWSCNAYSGYEYYLTGVLDEVRVWNYARSQQEIQDNMWGTLTGSETGLVGYWNCNEPAGTQIVYDLSPNHNDGQLGWYGVADSADPTRVVPEPGALSLLVLGGLAFLRRPRIGD